MSNLHRIQWIDAQIRAGCFPNARSIAERFEISPRQAARDIEYLRYSMGAPLEYYTARNGYCYSDGSFTLPAYFVTQEEKQALSYLAQQYRSVGTEQAAQLSSLFSRLTGGEEAGQDLKEHSGTNALKELPLPPPEKIMEEILQTAIEEKHKVMMVYVNGIGEKRERLFAPYKIFTTRNLRYVVGFCDLRSEIRLFRITRIERLKIIDSPFEHVNTYNPEDYRDDHPLRILLPYTAEVRLETSPRVPLRYAGECLGEKVYRFTFHSSEEFLNYLVSSIRQFTILSPQWLKEKLRDRLECLLLLND